MLCPSQHTHVGPKWVWPGLSNWGSVSFVLSFHVGPRFVSPDEMNTAQCARYRVLNVTESVLELMRWLSWALLKMANDNKQKWPTLWITLHIDLVTLHKSPVSQWKVPHAQNLKIMYTSRQTGCPLWVRDWVLKVK